MTKITATLVIAGTLIVSGAAASVIILKPKWFAKLTSSNQTKRKIASQSSGAENDESPTVVDTKESDDDSLASKLLEAVTHDREKQNRRYELQEDANVVCRSRSAVKNGASYYDEFVWKCNHPPYGVHYTDCNQYNVDQIGRELQGMINRRNDNEYSFAEKWGTNT